MTMHVETPDGWTLDSERVSTNSWELPFVAWVTNPVGFVVGHGRGKTEGRAAAASISDLRTNCSDAANVIDPLTSAFHAELSEPQRRSDSAIDLLPAVVPGRRRTDRVAGR
jgi:hypothetical protein